MAHTLPAPAPVRAPRSLVVAPSAAPLAPITTHRAQETHFVAPDGAVFEHGPLHFKVRGEPSGRDELAFALHYGRAARAREEAPFPLCQAKLVMGVDVSRAPRRAP